MKETPYNIDRSYVRSGSGAEWQLDHNNGWKAEIGIIEIPTYRNPMIYKRFAANLRAQN